MVDVSQNYLYCQNIIEMISALKIILFFDQGHDQRETFWLTGDKWKFLALHILAGILEFPALCTYLAGILTNV